MKTLEIYTYPQEEWSAEKCAKESKRVNRDGLGTVGGPRGLISHYGSPYPSYGRTVKYNGGTIVEGKPYRGVSIPLPKIPDGFRFKDHVSWGISIERCDNEPTATQPRSNGAIAQGSRR